MKIVVVCVAFGFAAASPALADEPDLGALRGAAQAAKPAQERWQECAAAVVRRGLSSGAAPAQLSDKALQNCAAWERALARILAGRIGRKEAALVVQELRMKLHASLVEVIETVRARR